VAVPGGGVWVCVLCGGGGLVIRRGVEWVHVARGVGGRGCDAKIKCQKTSRQ